MLSHGNLSCKHIRDLVTEKHPLAEKKNSDSKYEVSKNIKIVEWRSKRS